jgi:hypothetical protein
MYAKLLTLVVILVAVMPTIAQTPPPAILANGVGQGGEPAIACRAFPKTTESYKRKLWDGYEIALGPAANASGGGGDDCTAAIYNSQARVVYRTTGFNVTFDQNLTGQDFDSDGHPEVVFQTDSGGGNACCWAYNVISLYSHPHTLFDIGQEGAVQFEKDADGKMVIWERVRAPDVFNGPMAGSPFAERVFRVRDGKMVDSTPEFCSRIFGPGSRYLKEWNFELTPQNIEKLASAEQIGDQEDTGRALLERAYQHVLCRQYDEAIADLDLWPAASRAQTKAEFAKQVKNDFPDFAARVAH